MVTGSIMKPINTYGMQSELINIIGNINESTNGWWTFDCPLCDHGRHKEKAAVNFLFSYIKCWECGMGLYIDQYLREIEGMDYKDSLKYRSHTYVPKVPLRSTVELPEGFLLIHEESGIQDRLLRYLKLRGFDQKFLEKRSVGYCDRGDLFGYIIIPVINNGVLVYWTGRDGLNRSVPKYSNPKEVDKDVLYNADSLDIYDTVYHTEGIIDSWVIGDNAVASLGWSVTNRQLLQIIESNCKNYVIVPDPGYEGKAYQLASKISQHKNVYIKSTGTGDVNEIGKEKFKQLPITKFTYSSWAKI